MSTSSDNQAEVTNPLLEAWTAREMPPFDRIEVRHFRPAFERALAENIAEIASVAEDAGPVTFANTIDALERSGKTLDRVSAVFFLLAGTESTPEIREIEREMAPRLAKHAMAIHQNVALFRRVDALMRAHAELDLDLQQIQVLERYHRAFVKAGAKLDVANKQRLVAIAERHSVLATKFRQNVLADEQAFKLILESEDDLAGLPPALRAAAREAANELGLSGKYVITLARSSIEPFLQYSDRRELRERAFKAWIARGANGGEFDNRAISAEILALRAERARLLGFKTAADSALEFSMAKTPEAVRKLLMEVWGAARARVFAERDALQSAAEAGGFNGKIMPWDWRYYAEKVRKEQFDLDEAEIKPYLQLDNVIAAAFDVANKLFGLEFKQRADVSVYSQDVRVWEVSRDGRHIGTFLADYFARASKRSGAWMSALRRQEKLSGDLRPIVVNVLNLAKAMPGKPTLLSMDDARTLFHEFGHALHGLLSDVTYPMVAGTSVARDFVELPSQLYEHWITRGEVLGQFALHSETGRPMPDALLARLQAARNFNQGFATVEYLASAIVDLDLHLLEDATNLNVDKFETDTLARLAMPGEVVMRHRIPHFQHIMGGYAAGYYSYIWSEVMDADAFMAFEEVGDIFDPVTAKKLHDHIYSAGGSREPAELYMAFRGRLPSTDALLAKRGLTTTSKVAI
jgi:peptidyl-dipeptidase Dcp